MRAGACHPVSPPGHQGPCWSSGGSAQEQKETREGRAGEGCPHSAESPCPQGHGVRGTNPSARPRRVCVPGVSAPQDELPRPGLGVSPRTYAQKGHVPVDSLALPRRRQPSRQCERPPSTPQDTDVSFPRTFSSGSRGPYVHHARVLLPASLCTRPGGNAARQTVPTREASRGTDRMQRPPCP